MADFDESEPGVPEHDFVEEKSEFFFLGIVLEFVDVLGEEEVVEEVVFGACLAECSGVEIAVGLRRVLGAGLAVKTDEVVAFAAKTDPVALVLSAVGDKCFCLRALVGVDVVVFAAECT